MNTSEVDVGINGDAPNLYTKGEQVTLFLCGCGGFWGTTRLFVGWVVFLGCSLFFCLFWCGEVFFFTCPAWVYVENVAVCVWKHIESPRSHIVNEQQMQGALSTLFLPTRT